MDNQNNHSNKGIVIAVLCLIIGVVLGSVIMSSKTPAVSQEGAAIKSSATVTPAATTNSPYTPAQLEAQKKLKPMVVFQNSPEELSAAFGINPKNFTMRYDAKIRTALDQVFNTGNNPSGLPYWWCGTILTSSNNIEPYNWSGGFGYGYSMGSPCAGY